MTCRRCGRKIVPRFWGRVDGMHWSHVETKRVECELDQPKAEPPLTI